MRNKFGFATITSKEYIQETVGLIGNLKRLYPEYSIFICSVDDFSYDYFNVKKHKIFNFNAREVWKKIFWDNMSSRMLKRELAYASKSAFISYLLNNRLDSVILLDSDILIKSKIDDLINFSKSFSVTLTAARHPLVNWKRTNSTGIFSAGIIGFSKKGIDGVEWWKKECFDNTIMNEYQGLYNEQKYLDYLVGHFETKVILDDGINVSATIINSIKPYFSRKHNTWFTRSGKKIRVFHQSRATNHKIYADKDAHIKYGQDYLGKKLPAFKKINLLKENTKGVNKGMDLVNFVFKNSFNVLSTIFVFSIYFKRILFNNNYRLFSFLFSILKKKKQKEKLKR